MAVKATYPGRFASGILGCPPQDFGAGLQPAHRHSCDLSGGVTRPDTRGNCEVLLAITTFGSINIDGCVQ